MFIQRWCCVFSECYDGCSNKKLNLNETKVISRYNKNKACHMKKKHRKGIF